MDIVWAILSAVLRNAPGAIGRMLLGGVVGCILALVALGLWYRFVSGRRLLDVDRPWSRWVRIGITVIWVLGFPLLGAGAGAAVGAGYAARAVIVNERLGEQAGTLAFRGVTALVLAVTEAPDAPPEDIRRAVKRYLDGEAKVDVGSLADLCKKAPERLDRFVEADMEPFIRGEEDSTVRRAAASLASWIVKWLARSELEDRMSAITPVIDELQVRDTDGDKMATVEEVAAVLARLHLEPLLAGWVFKTVAMQALVPLLILLSLSLVPVIALRITARILGPAPAPVQEPEEPKAGGEGPPAPDGQP